MRLILVTPSTMCATSGAKFLAHPLDGGGRILHHVVQHAARKAHHVQLHVRQHVRYFQRMREERFARKALLSLVLGGAELERLPQQAQILAWTVGLNFPDDFFKAHHRETVASG